MRCTRCKKKLKKGAKFCPACGTRVSKKKGKRFVAFLLAVLLLLSLSTIGLAIYVFVSENFSLKQGLSKIFTAQSAIKIANVEEAIAHATELGKEFGYENAMSEMTEKVTTEIDGDRYYRLQQNYKGIPVYGRSLICAVDEGKSLTSITGNIQDIAYVDLSVKITYNDIEISIKRYFETELSDGNAMIGELEIGEISNDDLYIYTFSEDMSPHLAYCISVNGYEFFIDAQTGTILSASATIRAETGYLSSDTNRINGFPVVKNTDGLYILEDSKLHITVCNLNGKSGRNGKNRKNATLVTSSDLIFGNESGEETHEEAVIFYRNLAEIKKYITDTCGFDCYWVFAYYNDGYDNGKNAMGGPGGTIDGKFVGMVSMGSVTGVDDTDAIAHEYSHVISAKTVAWASNSVENSSICEGISDIFGEIVEAYCNNGSDPDWVMTGDNNGIRRNIHDPNGIVVAAHVNDSSLLGELGSGKEYYYSTVISHAAYLMWNGIDGSQSKKIASDDIIRLWYRAMLMMPSDCDFATCRQLVEWAALSVDGITEAQRNCIAEAFDMVGIHAQELSPEILINCDRNVRPGSYLNVYNVEGKLHSSYTLSISGTCAEHELAYAPTVLTDIGFQYKKTVEITNASSYRLDLPDGYYTFTITDSNNPKYTYTFTVSVSDQGTTDFIELHTDFENQLIVKIAKPPVSDTYKAYMTAVRKTTESGAWSERLDLTANMALTNGSAKTKTKMTMTSDADISNYSENDPSRVRISGAAEMSVLGQTYAWNMRYENGTAHYQYTQPNQTSADLKIDPSFFNFETMTSDMMTNAKMSGNQITFTVPGDKITEVGISAVNQMSGVDDLKYGDVDVIVTISSEGTIDTITMAFHASLKYQGYDADVDYNIVYRFSQSAVVSNMPSVAIVPCSYTGQDNKFDILTVHEVNGNQIVFTAWWYRIWDISHATATLDGNIASFDYTDANNPNIRAKGTIEFTDSKAMLTISECSVSEVHKGSYCFNFLAEALTEQQLKEVGHFLGVPDGLDVTYKQGTPYYWEAVGIYCTSVGIYYNKELVAAADVNSLNGEVAGGILMYSGLSSAENNDIAATFGYSKAWETHDYIGSDHFVTVLAFQDNGTFCCGIGFYLSDWAATFRGTYEVNSDEITLRYILNSKEMLNSYQVNWGNQTMKLTSVDGLNTAHQAGTVHLFEESPNCTAEELSYQVDLFQRYLGNL